MSKPGRSYRSYRQPRKRWVRRSRKPSRYLPTPSQTEDNDRGLGRPETIEREATSEGASVPIKEEELRWQYSWKSFFK